MKGIFISLGVGLVLVGAIVLWAIGVSNAEIKLRAKISGQQEMTEAFYTKLWEVIKTKAGVAEEYAEKFKEIQVGIMEGRYSTGGEMMKWIQEANPEFDASLYKDVMNSIEGQREGFFVEQKKLRDMSVVHEVMLKTFPKKLVIGKREAITVIILKNVATKAAYETGTDSSPVLFGKDKK
jgi:hypothetical protein